MTVREMHIEVNQALQKVSANRTRAFQSDEIDLVLNKILGRYIQSKVTPKKDGSGGFQIDQLDTDALTPLIITNLVLPAYISGNRYVTFLPSDYSHLLADSSNVLLLCGKLPVVEPVTLQVITLRQDKTPKLAPRYYLSVSVTLSSETVSIPGNLPYNNEYTGYPLKQDISFLTPYILTMFRRAGLQVYWENFDNLYKPSYYILVGANLAPTGSLSLDGFPVSQLLTWTKDMKKHVGGTVQAPNRLTASNIVTNLLSTAFYKPCANSPLSELEGTNLYTYSDGSFIVSNTVVSYLRKPQPISLLLGTDCELSDDYHQAICDLAVEYLKGTMENKDGLGITISDNERRVVL